MASPLDRFLALFKSPKPAPLPLPAHREELGSPDYQSRREIFPIIPGFGWTPDRILQMLESHDSGNFTASEDFYAALKREGLISAALAMRTEAQAEIPWTLQCPKDAPDEVHYFTEALARDWQSVMPDDVRAEITERTNVFGFQVCRIQWTWNNGQKQPRLIPYTHSSLSYRQDLWCYQGMSERGLETISSDGREWVVFSLGGTRPWIKGLIRPLAFIYFGLINGDSRWLNFNDVFAEPVRKRIVPRLLREGAELQRAYQREASTRGGDYLLCPQDSEHGRGYDFKYEQVDAQGYKTLAEQLARFDERAAICILGHNLLQQVKGGSLAAMRGALQLLRSKIIADCKILSSGMECVSKVWARANFGTDPSDFPELLGQPIESKSWSLVFDTSDSEAKKEAGVRASQFAQGLATFAKAAGPKLFELPIDWIEAAERCGIPMMSGEDSYSQDDDDDAELSAEEWIDPPQYMKAAAKRSLQWVHTFNRGGTHVGRSMARKIIRGKLTRADVLHIARYWPRHEVDKEGEGWDNLRRPSRGRIAWGLWGDSGDGRGRKWSEKKAEEIRGRLTATESATINAKLALLDGEPLPLALLGATPPDASH
jgi:hypothetical protein